jgi:ribose transport system substrate-binding protein
MKVQKRVFLLISVTLLAMLVVFASFNVFAAKKLVIGLPTRDLNTDFNRGVINGAKKVVEAAGGQLIVTDGQTDIRKHLDNISNLITRKVDGLIIQLGDADQLQGVIAKANTAGIPCVTTTVGQTTPGALTDVGADDELMTTMLMRQLVTDIKARGKVYIVSVPGAACLETRVRIAKAFLSGYSNIEVADVAPTQHSVPYTLNVMQNILTANPKPGSIAAVFVTYDDIASGAVQAIKNAGRGKDIKLYSIDGDPIGYRNLYDKEGPQWATVSQNSADSGALAAEMILKAIHGKKNEIPYAIQPKVTLCSKTNLPTAIKTFKEKFGPKGLETVLKTTEKEILK